MVILTNHYNREETDKSTSDTSLEKLSLASEEGSDMDRVPGTGSTDDDHILSPFNKRKGNVTDCTREVRKMGKTRMERWVRQITGEPRESKENTRDREDV